MKAVAAAVILFRAAIVTGWSQCFGTAVDVSSPSIETIGGVTYLRFTYSSVCPQQLFRKLPVSVGTNVSQTIMLVSDPRVLCPYEYPPTVHTNSATLVLGTFVPGSYACTVYAPVPFIDFSALWPVANIPFSVATTQTLSLISTGVGELAFRVEGISSVTYRIESSSNLIDWDFVRAFVGAPFAFTNRPTSAIFYRLQITDGVAVCRDPPPRD